MKKVARKFGRVELADYLADLSKQLRNGELAAEGHTWTVPEQVEVEIHFKEEYDQVIAKIKLWWPAAGEAAPGGHLSLKAVKAGLSASFKELQRLIMAGLTPDEQTLRDFMENSRAFASFVKPEWQAQLDKYLADMENLQRGVANRDLEAMQHALQVLVDDMIVCHRSFKP